MAYALTLAASTIQKILRRPVALAAHALRCNQYSTEVGNIDTCLHELSRRRFGIRAMPSEHALDIAPGMCASTFRDRSCQYGIWCCRSGGNQVLLHAGEDSHYPIWVQRASDPNNRDEFMSVFRQVGYGRLAVERLATNVPFSH
jgi:hypothetical protein